MKNDGTNLIKTQQESAINSHHEFLCFSLGSRMRLQDTSVQSDVLTVEVTGFLKAEIQITTDER